MISERCGCGATFQASGTQYQAEWEQQAAEGWRRDHHHHEPQPLEPAQRSVILRGKPRIRVGRAFTRTRPTDREEDR